MRRWQDLHGDNENGDDDTKTYLTLLFKYGNYSFGRKRLGVFFFFTFFSFSKRPRNVSVTPDAFVFTAPCTQHSRFNTLIALISLFWFAGSVRRGLAPHLLSLCREMVAFLNPFHARHNNVVRETVSVLGGTQQRHFYYIYI